MGDRFRLLCSRVLEDWRLLIPLLLANAAGMAFGWYYYFDVGQFDPASPYFEHPAWWPLVADSPNAVALFFVAAVARRLGRRWRWLDAAAFALNVYVGMWTTLLFLSYPERMGTFAGGTNTVLFLTHLGMPLQALLLAPDLRRDRFLPGELVAFAAALACYVAVDYWGPLLHPAPFLHPDDRALHVGSPLLMVAALGAFLVASAPWRQASRSTPTSGGT
ncbi:MAG TPA: DUF1405 domain-containing protein [Candidatus Thermoplasmatota archaeon]|nr:DUF1405 domain-containing protein [Candidatus Thermoplasmatota archaeon]